MSYKKRTKRNVCPPLKRGTTFDIISIGDATLDNFLQLNNATVDCDHQDKEGVCLICFRYADKIAVDGLHKAIGGNAANNAVGSSRLGLRSAIYTVLGDDDTGERIGDLFRKEGVSCAYIQYDKGKQTNFSVVMNHDTERTILVYHVDRKYKLPKLRKSSWIYFTSMGKGHQTIHEPLRAHIEKHGIKLAYNPGTHQLKAGSEVLHYMLEITEVLFVNVQEAQTILENSTSNIKNLLRGLRKLGVKIPVVTDGPKGAFVYDDDKFWKIGTTPTEVIERTGAGDSFATAFVAARMRGKTVPVALRWGTMNSASVIGYIGPEKGLLTESKIKTWLKKFPDIKAEEF